MFTGRVSSPVPGKVVHDPPAWGYGAGPAVPSPAAQVNKSRGYLYATAGGCLVLCGPQSGALAPVPPQKKSA